VDAGGRGHSERANGPLRDREDALVARGREAGREVILAPARLVLRVVVVEAGLRDDLDGAQRTPVEDPDGDLSPGDEPLDQRARVEAEGVFAALAQLVHVA